MKQLKSVLTEKGIQPSFQRMKILEVLRSGKGHPNVNTLHERLSRVIPTISKTTIYNTLTMFAEKGLASPMTITPDEIRYDHETAPHHHLLCRQCGAIIDVDIRCHVAERAEIDGHRIDEVHGYFRGICRDCLQRSSSEDHTSK